MTVDKTKINGEIHRVCDRKTQYCKDVKSIGNVQSLELSNEQQVILLKLII